ncbi:hypothetical protein [Arthrobacter sp. D3-16]
MPDGPDKRGSAKRDLTKGRPDDVGGAEDAEQQAEVSLAAPGAEPRRPRLYGYDPDYWPEQL